MNGVRTSFLTFQKTFKGLFAYIIIIIACGKKTRKESTHYVLCYVHTFSEFMRFTYNSLHCIYFVLLTYCPGSSTITSRFTK